MRPTLETKRLILRPFKDEDAERIVTYLNDIKVSGNLARVPHPYTDRDAEMWIDRLKANPDPAPGETAFAIEVREKGYAGTVGFHHGRSGGPELGYWLGEPFWNNGYMTEAARAARDWLFMEGDIETMASGAFAHNKPSLAIQRKLGFVEIGKSTVYCVARDQNTAHIDTQLTRARWMDRMAQGEEE